MRCKLTYLIFSFLIMSSPVYAVELCGKAMQGEILVGHAQDASEIKFNDTTIIPDENGTFLLALGRDEASKAHLQIKTSEGIKNYTLEIGATSWDIQNIKGIPPRKVTPSDSDMRSIEYEQKLVKAAQQTKNLTPMWQSGFVNPLEGRISGEFGGQRIMNGVKKNPHSGQDIAAMEGTPIKSSGDGIVTLSETGLFYSGNVVIIDHGYGLHTIYAHMKDINVKRGDQIKKGDIIGTVGKTGRATGPHLHWGASVNGIKFNPPSLLNINNNDDFCFNL